MHVRRPVRALLTAVLLAATVLVGTAGSPAVAASTSAVKGAVTLDGKALSGVKVTLMWTDDGDYYIPIGTDTTDSKGVYSFNKVTSQSDYGFRVRLVDPQARAVTTERSVVLKPGSTVTRNVWMDKAGSLRGKVVRADGASPTTVRLDLDGPDVTIGVPDDLEYAYPTTVKPAADGTWVLKGLPAGDYEVKLHDTAKTYADQCYHNVKAGLDDDEATSCRPEATPTATTTTLTEGQNKTLSTETMSHVANRVTGTVTDTSGNPLKGVSILPWRVGSDTTNGQEWDAVTQASGNFKVGYLPDGQWQLEIAGENNVYAPEWYDDAVLRSGAATLPLSGGQLASGLTIQLKSNATITTTTAVGTTSVKFAVSVSRRAGGVGYGDVTVSRGTVTKTAHLSGGKATISLFGIPAGTRTFTISYSGTASTAPAEIKKAVAVN